MKNNSVDYLPTELCAVLPTRKSSVVLIQLAQLVYILLYIYSETVFCVFLVESDIEKFEVFFFVQETRAMNDICRVFAI